MATPAAPEFAALAAHPGLLDLGLRLGEGSGAAPALALCQAAGRLLDEMATVEEARISTTDP